MTAHSRATGLPDLADDLADDPRRQLQWAGQAQATTKDADCMVLQSMTQWTPRIHLRYDAEERTEAGKG